MLNYFAISICKCTFQVVISSDVLTFFAQVEPIYFDNDTGTQLIPVFGKREDQYFKILSSEDFHFYDSLMWGVPQSGTVVPDRGWYTR